MADLDDLCGRMLGEFVLRERLDEGGFGAVYRCDQPLLGREAVVKVLHQRTRRRDVAMQRFMREAQLASRLDHPYAAHVYAFGIEEQDGLLWIAMELVQGITLNRWLREHGPMPLDQLVPFFERVAEVVQAAHEQGIVHRDLKPSNVMVIERAGQLLPKLLDFGVAKLLDDVALPAPPSWPAGSDHDASTDDTPLADSDRTPAMRIGAGTRRGRNRLTRASAAVGSPPYMSPEAWADSMAVGPASDLYALGVIAYEALTGRRPFNAETSHEYADLHREAAMPPLGDSFSPAVERVFERALAKRPHDRWGSALELAAALRTALRTAPREQLKLSAQQWQDRAQPDGLLWRGDALADLERWTRRAPSRGLSPVESSFVAASRRHARRAAWLRRLAVALTAAAVLAAIQYRAYLQTRMAEQVAELSITQAEVEQGRQALLHGESAEAQLHLRQAYARGDHSPGVAFMLARALQSQLAEQARLKSSAGRMWSALFSPDGRRIVTTDDKAARIWDAQTYKLLFTLPHRGVVHRAVYSPDGTRLITASGDGTVGIWDAATGTAVRELTHLPERREYFIVAMSPDCQFVAAINIAGSVADVWDAGTGTAVAELRNDDSGYSSLEFSADGRWLATSGGDDVRVFDTRTWERALTLPGTRVHALSFDPTGPRLVTGTYGGDASIWAIPDGARLRHLREIGEPIDAVAFSPSGELVVTAARDGAEQVWSATSGALQTQFNHLRGKIQSVEFDPSSRLVLAAGASGSVAVSDAARGMPVAVLDGPQTVVRVAHFDSTSRRVIGASWDGTARVWDATSPYRRWSSLPMADSCGLVSSLEPDRRFLAVGCKNQGVQVWDTARNELIAKLPSVTQVVGDFMSAFPAVSVSGDRAAIARGNAVEIYALPGGQVVRTVVHKVAVSAVAFAPAGHDIVSGSIDGAVLVTRDDHDPIALPMAPGGINAVAVLTDGRVVATDTHNRLRVYDPDQNTVLADLEAPTRMKLLRPSPDGRGIVTLPRYQKGEAPVLWDLESYRLVAQLEGHIGQAYSARFVAGNRILTAGEDGTARTWDRLTGRLLQTYRGSSRFLADAALDPAGSMVVAGGGDGLLRFWDAASGRPLWRLEAHKSYVVGIHFEGDDVVTRGFAGDVSRWRLPEPQSVIDAAAQVK